MVLHGEPVIQSVLLKYFTFVDRPEALINHGQCSQALQKVFKNSKFVMSGPCSQYTPVHGFMEFYPSAQLPKQDVWDVSCLGGWTAGNYVGSVADVARFTYELYNKKKSSILSSASQALLTNFSAPHMGLFAQIDRGRKALKIQSTQRQTNSD